MQPAGKYQEGRQSSDAPDSWRDRNPAVQNQIGKFAERKMALGALAATKANDRKAAPSCFSVFLTVPVGLL
jgi:hypothetical protein